MTDTARLLALPLLVVAFATAIFLSLDINGHRQRVYIADIAPMAGPGKLTAVFYNPRYPTYLRDSSIQFNLADWDVVERGDSVALTARSDRSVLTLKSYGSPVYVSLERQPAAGTTLLRDGLGNERAIELHADSESLYSFNVGGDGSIVPAVPGHEFIGPRTLYGTYAALIGGLGLLAVVQVYQRRRPAATGGRRVHPVVELAGYAAPLIITPLFVQLTHWPASVSFDGALQWMEASVPGHLSPAIVIPATLLFRLFAQAFGNPAFVVFGQILFGALGAALILREIRRRGASRRTVQIGALVIALLPQYPTFFAYLSKDAWNCVGILFTTYSALALLRYSFARPHPRTWAAGLLVVLLILSAVFAGAMRPNTLPAILAFMLILTVYFARHRGAKVPAVLFTVYLAAALGAPRVAIDLSAEGQARRADPLNHPAVGADGQPLGIFANMYLIHFFAAAVSGGADITPQDAQVFYAVAPKAAWQDYDCSYTDKTQMAVRSLGLMDDAATPRYFAEHQVEMARIVAKLMIQNPGILLQRQACVSRILWYIGYRSSPFQVNATIGYDSLPQDFLSAVGENHSLIGKWPWRVVRYYIAWSEYWTQMWLFWKPFGYVALGLFAVLLYSVVNRRNDVLLVAMLPLLMTLSLAIFIPFPAFRYEYPAMLVFMLLFLVALARPGRADTASPPGH